MNDILIQKTIKAGWEIFNRKGNTCYGIAAATTAIAKSILFNENRIYPVTVELNGEYGVEKAFLSVPTIIDSTGAKEIVEIKLTDEELEKYIKENSEKTPGSEEEEDLEEEVDSPFLTEARKNFGKQSSLVESIRKNIEASSKKNR